MKSIASFYTICCRVEYRHELQAVREKEEMEARERALQEQQERERRLEALRQQVCVRCIWSLSKGYCMTVRYY